MRRTSLYQRLRQTPVSFIPSEQHLRTEDAVTADVCHPSQENHFLSVSSDLHAVVRRRRRRNEEQRLFLESSFFKELRSGRRLRRSTDGGEQTRQSVKERPLKHAANRPSAGSGDSGEGDCGMFSVSCCVVDIEAGRRTSNIEHRPRHRVPPWVFFFRFCSLTTVWNVMSPINLQKQPLMISDPCGN